MRETSYHAVIAEMTVRALWELQNLLDCIPDALWDRCYGGAPLWQHVCHTLHELGQWFINPRDTDFVEPPIHTPHLQELHIYPAVRLDRPAIDDYFYTIKAKLSIYLTSLHDEDLLQRPDNCEWTRFTLILSQYRHLHTHLGMLMGFIVAEPEERRGLAEENYERLGVLRIATKYPNITRAFFEEKGVQVDVIKMHGNIELAPLVGMADRIVDISATGTTLRENNLRIVDEVLSSTARFIANSSSVRTDVRVRELAARLEELTRDRDVSLS